MAKPIDGIFSIRIVVADYYMQRPIPGLDPCYSEFRGKEIKSIPIIRIFGTNAEGQKTCMHVHGVLPYLYIPYESKDLGAIDKFIYQISISLDKAINISLGQGSSDTQHIFKVQLVKGIPFYGYHKSEHQYLKIFFYQPRFIKRAANLLQNGVILGKVFQPHESHVPYILQFLIDYNLYGMSFLHAPKEIVKFRRGVNDVVLYDIPPSQILDRHIGKLSTSQLEVDISAAFILNRFQLLTRKSQHTNPGIESIWQDEKRRRQLLPDQSNIPVLEVAPIEERPNAIPTESDTFFKKKLINRLNEFNEANDTLNQSIMSTTSLNNNTSALKKSKFNLSKFLINSVYPEECSQNEPLMNASIIHDHMLSNKSMIDATIIDKKPNLNQTIEIFDDEDEILENSIIDTDTVLNLTQQNENPKLDLTMRDYEVLEVMRQLEEGTNENDNLDLNTKDITYQKKSNNVPILEVIRYMENGVDNGTEVDLDSTLAPLSQNHHLSGEKNDVLSEDEDDNSFPDYPDFSDFPISMEDIDRIYENLEKINSIPQLDGGDNEVTPKKLPKTRDPNSPQTPRTSRSRLSLRYAPLSIISKSPKSIKKDNKKDENVVTDSDEDVVLISSGDSDSNTVNHSLLKRRKKRIERTKNIVLEKTPTPTATTNNILNNNKKKEARNICDAISLSSDDSSQQSKSQLSTKTENSSPLTILRTRRSTRSAQSDKTLISCNLKPPKSSERKLKFYDIHKNPSPNNPNTPKLNKNLLLTMRKCVVRLKHTPPKPSNLLNKKENVEITATDANSETPPSPPHKKFKFNTVSATITTPPISHHDSAKQLSQEINNSAKSLKTEIKIEPKIGDDTSVNNPQNEEIKPSTSAVKSISVISADKRRNEMKSFIPTVKPKIEENYNDKKKTEEIRPSPTASIPEIHDTSKDQENTEEIKPSSSIVQLKISENSKDKEKAEEIKPSSSIIQLKISENSKDKEKAKEIEPSSSIIQLKISDTSKDKEKAEEIEPSSSIIQLKISDTSKDKEKTEEIKPSSSIIQLKISDTSKDKEKTEEIIPSSSIIQPKISDTSKAKEKTEEIKPSSSIIQLKISENSKDKEKTEETKPSSSIIQPKISDTSKDQENTEEIKPSSSIIQLKISENSKDKEKAEEIEPSSSIIQLKISDTSKDKEKTEEMKLSSLNEQPKMIDTSKDKEKSEEMKLSSSKISDTLKDKEKKEEIKPPILAIKPKTRKCKVLVKRYNLKGRKGKDMPRPWSPSDVAREYDRRNNFFPEPGPSHINYYELIQLPTPKPNKPKVTVPPPSSFLLSKINLKSTPKTSRTPRTPKTPRTPETPRTPKTPKNNIENIHKLIHRKTMEFAPRPLTPCKDSDEDSNLICSFYEKSLLVNSPSIFINSPSLFSDKDSPISSINRFTPISNSQKSAHREELNFLNNTNNINPVAILPSKEKLYEDGTTDVQYLQPFYSNPEDITNKHKEVGNKILKIGGNPLNDNPNISYINDIDMQRQSILLNSDSTDIMNNLEVEYNPIREMYSITPIALPPTPRDAMMWLKARELLKNQDESTKNETKYTTIHINLDDDEDSPIEIPKEKLPLMMINKKLSGNNNCSDDDDDADVSRISLSPMTPGVKTSSSKTATHETPTSSRTSSKAKLCLSKKIIDIQLKNLQNKIYYAPPSILDDELPASYESEKSNYSISHESMMRELQKSIFKNNLQSINEHNDSSFGLSGPTLNNTFGFKVNLENLQNAKADIEYNYLTTMSLEIYVPTRNTLKPNPEFDPIKCIFYSIHNNVPDSHELPQKHYGYIFLTLDDPNENPKFKSFEESITVVDSEQELFNQLLQLCRFWDPDILAGYEIEMNSWGYVIDRSKVLGFNLVQLLSRIPSQKIREKVEEDEEKEQFTDLETEMRLCGRILLDVWRLMRSEIALTSYTYENVMYHILHKRVPYHNHHDLTEWYSSPYSRWIVLDYLLAKARGTLDLLEQLDLIGRTSEMAKLIGIQFYEVLSRGSQYRVESMMLRIAKPKNLIPLSPSVDQRVHMRAPEYLPLILEPESRFYTDPIIVLDFQSLYPSIIIAYNYCFSTCLGRAEHIGQSTTPFEFGASQLRVSPIMLKKLLTDDMVTVSPCGSVFIKSNIREGVLPRMLSEILDTRLMVKQSMKIHKSNSILQRVLHSRQLGLKLMANVTYGYTAANFSGRMPCVEVGDSVVAKGRETLERAIQIVDSNTKWRAKVVYGDTDSLFVLCAGRSRTDAFKIGEEISAAVTNDNPYPVKLKLEKIYHPCILQTKKRYVGYMYESVDQEKPTFEAKGIETVRRDGCPAVGKILEKSLRILFETRDISQIKEYVCRQFTKLLQGKANLQDLIYAKEFRGKFGYKPSACVPALELTKKWLKIDPRNEPRRGERVPYVIVNGPPGVPLFRLVRSPHEFLADDGLKINAVYYINKAIIPPLNRCLLLIGADVNDWYLNLPRKKLFNGSIASIATTSTNPLINGNATKKSTISQYFSSSDCVIDCGGQTTDNICTDCLNNPGKCVFILYEKIAKIQRSFYQFRTICQACCGRGRNLDCDSLDCPAFYIKCNKSRDFKKVKHYNNLIDNILIKSKRYIYN